MKKFLFQYSVFTAITFFSVYLPLSFAALSFNPSQWAHWERFVLGMCLLLGALALVFAKGKGDSYFKI
jgi:hypothetical protein